MNEHSNSHSFSPFQVDQSLQMQNAMAMAQNQAAMNMLWFNQPMVLPQEMQYLILTVRRDHIVQDTMTQVQI